jgi:membrane protease YdiL (CAAX protease family)
LNTSPSISPSISATVSSVDRRRPRERTAAVALLTGLGAAVALRVLVGAHLTSGGTATWTPNGVPGVAGSLTAGLVFAGCLLALCAAAGWQLPRPAPGAALLGLAGALVLCLPALISRLTGPDHAAGNGFLLWAIVVAVVASAEEGLLRGALYDALAARAGVWAAIAVGALAFALLHVPLYGWGAVPLDAAVGVWLGMLRAVSGSVTAPAVAHVLADWAGFWLR